MSAFNAFSLILSPSWISLALLVLPSRLELKSPDGSSNEAPLAKVIFTTFLYVSPVQIIPSKVFLDCGINVDHWYPLPRRMIATAGFMRAHRREREHCRRALDTLRERFDIRGGPVI